MDPWKLYDARSGVRGTTPRDAALKREQAFLARKLQRSLSYHDADVDGERRRLAIINTDNLDTKTVCSWPGEDLPHGGYVSWLDQNWLVVEKDYNNEVYTRAKMRQCNYLLKWVSDDNQIVERWCIVEDGTKYLTGEFADRDFIVTRGDARIAIILPRDAETVRLDRERRFIVDDPGTADSPMAFRLTKPLRIGSSYGESGCLKFVLSECATEDTDDLDNRIPNYYRYFPRNDKDTPGLNTETTTDDGKKVWF